MQSLILLRFLYFDCNVYPVQCPCNLSSFSVSYTSIVMYTLSNVHAISHPSPFLILQLYTLSMQSLTLLRSLYFHCNVYPVQCPYNLSSFSVPYSSIVYPVHPISHSYPFLILPLYTLSMKYLTLLRSLIILPLYTLTMQSLILLRFLYFHSNVYPVQCPCNLSSFSVPYTSIVYPVHAISHLPLNTPSFPFS